VEGNQVHGVQTRHVLCNIKRLKMKARRIIVPLLAFSVLVGTTTFCAPISEPSTTEGTAAPKATEEVAQATTALGLPTDTPTPTIGYRETPSAVTQVPVAPTPTPYISPPFSGWTTTGLSAETVYVLAVSPNYADDLTLFAGGDGKVWRSTDGSDSWTASVPAEGQVVALAVSPNFATDHTVFAALSASGLYKSTDSGDSWVRISENSDILSLAVSPDYANDQTVFFGAMETWNSGAFRSQDGGNSWVQVVNGLHNVFVFSLAISPDFANDHTILAGTNGFLFSSRDGADTWGSVLGGWPCLLGAIHSIVISPNYATDGMAFAASGNYVLIRDRRWSCPEVEFPEPIHTLAISPDYASDHTLFAGTPNRVLVSSDSGNTWIVVNGGLESLNVYALVVAPPSMQVLFAATDQGVWKNTME
jgi:photosystem II stability/assembly factor-like uncharacterized protein